jgi:hypothetical protein
LYWEYTDLQASESFRFGITENIFREDGLPFKDFTPFSIATNLNDMALKSDESRNKSRNGRLDWLLTDAFYIWEECYKGLHSGKFDL